MVNPIYIVVVLLGTGFLLPALKKLNNKAINFIFLSALGFSAFVGLQWLSAFIFDGSATLQIFTAGVKPPISINLQMGLQEAIFISSINVLALLGGIFMIKDLDDTGVRSKVLFMLMILGFDGLVMTRDIFNIFVFIEISSIATYSMIGMDLRQKSLSAGFKYMLAGSIASAFLLLGIIILYRFTGTLNLDGMIAAMPSVAHLSLIPFGLFILFFAMIVEMKQFPANGWALDVYEGSSPAVAGIISAAGTAAMFFTIYKVLPLLAPFAHWYHIIAGIGLITFVASNLMGLKQNNSSRMLGYSSVSQMGLLLFAAGFGFSINADAKIFAIVIIPLFLNHFVAKAGLFWLADIVKKENYKDWSVLRHKPLLLITFAVLLLGLIGFPPFPGFWGKWSLVLELGHNESFFMIWVLLLGSLLEAVYMLRWFGYAVKGNTENTEPVADNRLYRHAVIAVLSVIFVALGYHYAVNTWGMQWQYFVPVAAGLVFYILDFLPSKLKGIMAIGAVSYYAYLVLPGLEGFARIFDIMFLGGSILLLISTLARDNKQVGFYPLLITMIGSLSLLVESTNVLQFFFAWEIMTLTSYLLIIRGKKARKSALQYVIFSLGGAFSILIGFAYAYSGVALNDLSFNMLSQTSMYTPIIFITLAIGFLVKSGAIGLHTWVSRAYADAEDDFTTFISAILSKAGVFGIILLLLFVQIPKIANIDFAYILGWIGILTAIGGTLMALFQEDAKKLLAYSSMAQIGYVVVALAAMTSLGWTAGIYQTINHFLIKAVLFMAIAGVIYRTGTSNMYQMGGLIKKMPWSFTAVMFGIIALSGVPPLTGFGAKWLIYEALIEKGWYLQTGGAFFASTAAFLYLFRLIHSIFLGQAKDEFREVKEAPAWFIVPQYILIAVIMWISTSPKYLLDQITSLNIPAVGQGLTWEGATALSSLGYWNATAIMMVVMVLFIGLTLVLLIKSPKVQKVKQFNIVYAAERPERPELTHYAWQFFKPYERALGFLIVPRIRGFWDSTTDVFHEVGDSVRKIYTGNAQTYAFFILLFGLILFTLTVGAR